jgi:hypothetical protein
MGLFGPSLPVERDEFDCLLACFAWIDRTLGARDGTDGFAPRLVLPHDPDLVSAAAAKDLFEAVKHAAGLEQWPCRLEKGETRRAAISTGLATGITSQKSALGTFSIEGNIPVIRYDPALLRQPEALVATFAHELAHLVIHSLGMPPGGAALEEHATDCMAVYLGFGVFLANSARQFSQFEDGAIQGWQSETSGYLSENALVTVLAMFERRFATNEDAAATLKPYLRSVHGKAHKYLAKHHSDFGATLDAVELSVWA